MRGDVDRDHFVVADLDSCRIGGVVNLAFDVQAGARGGRGDQLHDCLVADERLAAPVLRNEREQPVVSTEIAGSPRQ